jgi:hypothetical protein
MVNPLLFLSFQLSALGFFLMHSVHGGASWARGFLPLERAAQYHPNRYSYRQPHTNVPGENSGHGAECRS